MRPYSVDLRVRVVESAEGGMARTEVARVFAVSLPTIKRWLRQCREMGALAPKPVPGPAAVKTAGLPAALPERLAARTDATLEGHCSWWRRRSGHEVSRATTSRAIAALGWTW